MIGFKHKRSRSNREYWIFLHSPSDIEFHIEFTAICYWTDSNSFTKMAGHYSFAKTAKRNQANFKTYLLFSIWQVLHKAKWPQTTQIWRYTCKFIRLPHPWSEDSQGRETVLAPPTDNQIYNYDTECSNHHLYLYIFI